MMGSNRLGATITAEDINDFFSLRPIKPAKSSSAAQKSVKARDELKSGPKTAEERRPASRDIYTIVSDPAAPINDVEEEDVLTPPEVEEIDLEGLNNLEDTAPEPKGPDHPALNVYDNYKFDHEYDPDLPITENREWVVGTIETNQVTIIQGATGSGKTTQVPQYILDHYYEKRQYCNILVTQPRRIAAESIAKRVSEERGWPLGHLVGFQVGRNRNVSEDTRITYMTTGVLLEKLIQKKNMNDYTHIILDEVHERDQHIDLAMLVVKKLLNTVSRHVKVVLMSATMDCSLFSKYFSVAVRGKLEGAPVVSVEGKMFDVAEYYLDHLRTLGNIPIQNISDPDVSDECYQIAKRLIIEFDRSEAESQGITGDRKFPAKRGTVLVFLPGIFEIDALHKHLEKIEIERNLQILVLHSSISSSDQYRVFLKPQGGKRKVILSTNIAESSITVPDIKYVIDFCLVRNMETDMQTNYQSLHLRWASKSSLNQRKGRAGRVSDGECFRLVTRNFYRRLSDYGVPEMQRCPLHHVVLRIKLLDMGDPCTLLNMALQPPDRSDIRRTIILLKEIGALTLKQRGRINPLDGDLTFVGKVLGSLPVDIRIGKLLILGHVFGCLNECLIIAAALSLKSCFATPFKRDFESYSHKMQWANWSFSDCLAVLNCYGEWKHKKEIAGFGREGEGGWGRKNFIQTKMMNETDQLIKELEGRLRDKNIRRSQDGPIYARRGLSPDDMLILKLVICGAFYPFYFVSGEVDDAEGIKTLSGHDPFSTVMLYNVPSPGILYKKKIASLIRPCGRGKFLHFENSRCYIEFDRSHLPSNQSQIKVLPAVYLAIKMRHLRMGLHVFVQKEKHDDFKRKLENLQISDPSKSVLRTGSLTTSLESSDGRLELTQSNQVSIPTSGYTQVHVTVALEAGHFWAHLGNKETFQSLEEMQREINIMGGTNLSKIPNGLRLKPGEPVLAWYDQEFYRAKVIAEEGYDRNNDFVKVFFLDYGNTEVLPREALRRCPECFLKLPYQAFECCLCEIRPVHGQWSEVANERFHDLTQEKVLLAKVFSIVQNCVRLDLYLDEDDPMAEDSEHTHINKILIDEGYAQKCEESYMSKLTKENSERMEKSLTESQNLLSKLDDSSETHQIEEYEATKIQLRGPFSPFEISFYSLTSNGRLRATVVEKNSVNSVFICEETQDKHPRFMVSANVGVNATGNTLIARDTTVMPNIHGIASIIPVLFAPFAEYRIDRQRTKIIGAICGLGYVESNNSPILPEHDMEVTFDVKFTKEDVNMVNSVRKGINYVFKNEESWGTSALEKIQNFTRKHILDLIQRKRDDIERTEYSRPYQWNQLPDIARLEPANEDGPSVPLYALHCGVWVEDPEDSKETVQMIKKRQVRDLYGMAGRSRDYFEKEVVCSLCNVSCRHPFELKTHLESRLHVYEETRLFSKNSSQ